MPSDVREAWWYAVGWHSQFIAPVLITSFLGARSRERLHDTPVVVGLALMTIVILLNPNQLLMAGILEVFPAYVPAAALLVARRQPSWVRAVAGCVAGVGWYLWFLHRFLHWARW
jgi:hypothetical protein